MNKYIKWGAIFGFIFGFLLIFIVQIAQRDYCPFEPLIKHNLPIEPGYADSSHTIEYRNNKSCPNNLTTPDKSIGNAFSCKDGIIVVRSNCLSFLTGTILEGGIIIFVIYGLVYSLIGLIVGLIVSLIGYLYEKFKNK